MRKHFEFVESLRGGAALYVFLTHFVPQHVISKHGAIGLFLRFGQEAVMLFFLVSGFVIAHSEAQRPNQRFAEYLKKRFLRIYPVFVVAMLSSWLLAWAQQRALPSVGWWDVIGNLAMLQDFSSAKPGTFVDPFMGNSPLWSLSYEWWFYMLFFPLAKYVPESRQRLMAGLLSAAGLVTYLIIPNQISLFCLYFFIWWTGVELCRTMNRAKPLDNSVLIILSGYCGALFINATVCSASSSTEVSYGTYPVLLFRHFTAALLCVALYVRFATTAIAPRAVAVLRPLAIFAPFSYGLYALQYPFAVSIPYLEPLPKSAQVIGYATAAFVAAYSVEAFARRAFSGKRAAQPSRREMGFEADSSVISAP